MNSSDMSIGLCESLRRCDRAGEAGETRHRDDAIQGVTEAEGILARARTLVSVGGGRIARKVYRFRSSSRK